MDAPGRADVRPVVLPTDMRPGVAAPVTDALVVIDGLVAVTPLCLIARALFISSYLAASSFCFAV